MQAGDGQAAQTRAVDRVCILQPGLEDRAHAAAPAVSNRRSRTSSAAPSGRFTSTGGCHRQTRASSPRRHQAGTVHHRPGGHARAPGVQACGKRIGLRTALNLPQQVDVRACVHIGQAAEVLPGEGAEHACRCNARQCVQGPLPVGWHARVSTASSAGGNCRRCTSCCGTRSARRSLPSPGGSGTPKRRRGSGSSAARRATMAGRPCANHAAGRGSCAATSARQSAWADSQTSMWRAG